MGILTNGLSRSTAKEVAIFAATNVALIFAVRYLVSTLDPARASRTDKERKSKAVLGRLGVRDVQLSEHEATIAGEVIHPDDIDVKFDDIGGLEPIIDSLKEAIIFPLTYPKLFESSAGLFSAPKGVLLYGPPGCGKTLLAKALAKESGATFINIKASVLQDKWYGESNKLVSALFSLARKLQPSIIFIDELDAFLRERSRNDHEISGMVKAEFMSCWDGLTSVDDRILVLGATNRPNDIDQAILRRMPKRFAIKLPSPAQRKSILSLMLRDIKLEKGFDLDDIVRRTDRMSGSDLKEICRAAASVPVREVMRDKLHNGGPAELERAKREGFAIRPLRNGDFSCDLASLESNPGSFATSRTGYVQAEGLD